MGYFEPFELVIQDICTESILIQINITRFVFGEKGVLNFTTEPCVTSTSITIEIKTTLLSLDIIQ